MITIESVNLRPDVAATVDHLVRDSRDYLFAKQMIGRACGWESEEPDESQFVLAIREFCKRTGK